MATKNTSDITLMEKIQELDRHETERKTAYDRFMCQKQTELFMYSQFVDLIGKLKRSDLCYVSSFSAVYMSAKTLQDVSVETINAYKENATPTHSVLTRHEGIEVVPQACDFNLTIKSGVERKVVMGHLKTIIKALESENENGHCQDEGYDITPDEYESRKNKLINGLVWV